HPSVVALPRLPLDPHSFPTRRSSDLLNWMSTLNGLLQMKEYDRVLAMVQGESQAQQQLIDSLREAFADRQVAGLLFGKVQRAREDRKSTRLNSSHVSISYAVFCLKKK